MNNDRKINITVGQSRKSTVWTAQELMWSELVEKLKTPARSTESFAEYISYNKTQQDKIKDVGGFVAGTLEGTRRKANNILTRDVITLDLDNIKAEDTQHVLRIVDSLGCGYCIYSTRKHCESAPRLRILIPLNCSCTADEYEPIGRKLAEFIGMEMCDPSTFEASRLMYWPSCSSDSQYIYTYSDKPFIDADGTLSLYKDWRNVQEWKGLVTPKLPRGAKQQDPTLKEGIVGAFCKTYNIYQAIDAFIPDEYIQCDNDTNRFTYSKGSTTGGAVVYEGGNFLFSHHATDPAGGKLCNAFDLVRCHLFPELDDEVKPDTPTNKLPSFVEMCKFAVGDSEVAGLLNKEKYDKAVTAFNAPVPAIQTPEATQTTDWMKKLQLSEKTGNPTKTTDNMIIILDNDPLLMNKLVFDEFSNRVITSGGLPWDARKEPRNWNDNDDSGLRHYLEKVYAITGKDKIMDACSIVCNKHKINEVQQFIKQLPEWDGIKRIDTIFSDYLGAEDNSYTKAVARKSFTAAIARAMTPGIKYDQMPILAGPQGIGKSTLLRLMGGRWFSDSLVSFEGKEACEMIQGTWINELGELNGLSRAETNAVKQFLSKTDDIYREAYGRRTGQFPRRCVFFGTTNDSEFLKDRTGNRRFWPIDCGVIKPKYSVFKDLVANISQLWAEVLYYWQIGESLYLDGEAERLSVKAQEEHAEQSAKEGIIREFIERKITKDWQSKSLIQRKMYWSGDFISDNVDKIQRDKVCALEIWCEAFNGDAKYFKKQDAAEINGILENIPGWVKSKNGVRVGKEYGLQRVFLRVI